MILVPFFASSTVYGSTKNLLSLPFQAPVFFDQGACRSLHETAGDCRSLKKPARAQKSQQKLTGTCRNSKEPQEPTGDNRTSEAQARACSSLQELPAASRSLQELHGAHRSMQEPAESYRSPEKPTGTPRSSEDL